MLPIVKRVYVLYSWKDCTRMGGSGVTLVMEMLPRRGMKVKKESWGVLKARSTCPPKVSPILRGVTNTHSVLMTVVH